MKVESEIKIINSELEKKSNVSDREILKEE